MKYSAAILALIPAAAKWIWRLIKSKAELEVCQKENLRMNNELDVVKEEREVLKKELKRLRARLRKISKSNENS